MVAYLRWLMLSDEERQKDPSLRDAMASQAKADPVYPFFLQELENALKNLGTDTPAALVFAMTLQERKQYIEAAYKSAQEVYAREKKVMDAVQTVAKLTGHEHQTVRQWFNALQKAPKDTPLRMEIEPSTYDGLDQYIQPGYVQRRLHLKSDKTLWEM